MSAASLRPNARVIFQSLQARADLNGIEGELLSFVEASGRWATRIISSGECIKVKPPNVRLGLPLRERLSACELEPILLRCESSTLKILRLVDRGFLLAATAVVGRADWRRGRDNEQLASWRTASNMCAQGGVYGFFTLSPGRPSQKNSPVTSALHGSSDSLGGQPMTARSASGRLTAHVTAARSDGAGATVDIWDTVSGTRRLEASLPRAVDAVAMSPDGRRLAVGFSPPRTASAVRGGSGDAGAPRDVVQIFALADAELRLEHTLECTPPPEAPSPEAPLCGGLMALAWAEEVGDGSADSTTVRYLLCSRAVAVGGAGAGL